jgi:hypothetical protein
MTDRDHPRTLDWLYLNDEPAWLEETARQIAAGCWQDVDAANLQEYLESAASRERRSVLRRLAALQLQRLLWQTLPNRRSRGWRIAIDRLRDDVVDDLAADTLRQIAIRDMDKAYCRAVDLAEVETGLPRTAFPADCPFTLDQLLSESLFAE